MRAVQKPRSFFGLDPKESVFFKIKKGFLKSDFIGVWDRENPISELEIAERNPPLLRSDEAYVGLNK